MSFVKKDLKECFEDIKTSSAGVGILGMMVRRHPKPSCRGGGCNISQGNKGGTAIQLNFCPKHPTGAPSLPTVLTFVNSHLAAFEEMVERRNADFHDLSSRLLFRRRSDQASEAPVENSPQATVSVFDTDVLFWMGGG